MKLTEVEEPALFLLGIELLDTCGQTLFETLERQLKPHFGEDWFSLSLVRTPEDRELAPRDLSVLLVQIEIRNNQKFRLALQSEYNSGRPLEESHRALFTPPDNVPVSASDWMIRHHKRLRSKHP